MNGPFPLDYPEDLKDLLIETPLTPEEVEQMEATLDEIISQLQEEEDDDGD